MTWYYVAGTTRLGIPYNKIGRLTLKMFTLLWEHYKDLFDAETILRTSGSTWAKAVERQQKSQEWF